MSEAGGVASTGVAIESLPIAAYLIDDQGLITHFNAKAVELWGRVPAVGERWCGSYRLFDSNGAHVDLANCPMAYFIRTGEFPPTETALLERPDGQLRMIKAHPSVVRGSRGELLGFLNLVVDVTGVSKPGLGSGVFSDRDELLENILRAEGIGFTVFDFEAGKAVKANDHFLRIIDAERSDFVEGRISCQDLTPPEYGHLDEAALAEARAKGFWSPFEKEYQLPSGRRVPVRISSAPIADLPGHCLVCVEDLTIASEATKQVELLRSEVHHLSRLSAMGTMAAVLAHEVAQPFAAIKNALWVLEQDLPELAPAAAAAKRQSALALIKREAGRGHHLVERLRTFSRPAHGRKHMVDLEATVRGAVELLLFRLPRVRFTYQFAKDARFAFADPIQIEQVMLNLLRNALEAVSSNGRIRVKAEAVGSMIEVSITDNGTGLCETALQNAFLPFASSKPEGTGLGLSICRSIIEQHGGTIVLLPLKRGAKVVFSVPRYRAGEPELLPEVA